MLGYDDLQSIDKIEKFTPNEENEIEINFFKEVSSYYITYAYRLLMMELGKYSFHGLSTRKTYLVFTSNNYIIEIDSNFIFDLLENKTDISEIFGNTKLHHNLPGVDVPKNNQINKILNNDLEESYSNLERLEVIYLIKEKANNKKKDLSNAKFEVKIYKIIAGWLLVDLICNSNRIRVHISYAFDPLKEIFEWFENIISNDYRQIFCINEETNVTALSIKTIDEYESLFILYSPSKRKINSEGEEIDDYVNIYGDFIDGMGYLMMEAIIDTEEFIGAFYVEFLSYAYSDLYKPFEWEEISRLNLLKHYLRKSEIEIINNLLLFSNRQLLYLWSFLFDSNNLLNECDDLTGPWFDNIIKNIFNNEDVNLEEYLEEIIYDAEQFIHYNNLNEEEKKIWWNTYLEEIYGGFEGYPLKQIKSKIIEEYLGIDESYYANPSI